MSRYDAWNDVKKIRIEKERIALDVRKIEIETKKIQLESEKLILETTRTAHSRWWQEDALVHNRLTWLLHSQTVLIATYGYFHSKKQEAKSSSNLMIDLNASQQVLNGLGNRENIVLSGVGRVSVIKSDQQRKEGDNDTIDIVPWVGFLICIVIFFGVHAARTAQRYLKKEYAEKRIGVGVTDETSRGGMLTSYLIPLVFIFGWGYVFGRFYWGAMFFLSGLCCAGLFEVFLIKHNLRFSDYKAIDCFWYSVVIVIVLLWGLVVYGFCGVSA